MQWGSGKRSFLTNKHTDKYRYVYLLLVELRLAVIPPGGEGVPLGVPEEGEQGDGEPEGVKHLVFNGREEDIKLLGLQGDRTRTEVSVSSYRPKQL